MEGEVGNDDLSLIFLFVASLIPIVEDRGYAFFLLIRLVFVLFCIGYV